MSRKVHLINNHELISDLTLENVDHNVKHFTGLVNRAIRQGELIPINDQDISDLEQTFEFELRKVLAWIKSKSFKLPAIWYAIESGDIPAATINEIPTWYNKRRYPISRLRIRFFEAVEDLAEANPLRDGEHYFCNLLKDATDEGLLENESYANIQDGTITYDLMKVIAWAQDKHFNIPLCWWQMASILDADMEDRLKFMAEYERDHPNGWTKIKELFSPEGARGFLPDAKALDPTEILTLLEVEQLLEAHHIPKPYQVLAHASTGSISCYIKDTNYHYRWDKQKKLEPEQQQNLFPQRYTGYARIMPDEIKHYWYHPHEASKSGNQYIMVRCTIADAEHNRGIIGVLTLPQHPLPSLLFLKSDIKTFYGIKEKGELEAIPVTPAPAILAVTNDINRQELPKISTVKPLSKIDKLIADTWQSDPNATNEQIWDIIRKRVKKEEEALTFIEKITPWGKAGKIIWYPSATSANHTLSQKSFQNKLSVLRKKNSDLST